MRIRLLIRAADGRWLCRDMERSAIGDFVSDTVEGKRWHRAVENVEDALDLNISLVSLKRCDTDAKMITGGDPMMGWRWINDPHDPS